jgi:hypothetical protein
MLEVEAAVLDAETGYNITVWDLVDSEGIRLAPLSWSFRTRDCPRVVKFAPLGDNQPLDPEISITFSRDMNRSSVESNLVIWPIGYYPYTTAWVGNTLSIRFQNLLYYGWQCTVRINGSDQWYDSCAKDSEGVRMKSTFASAFRTRQADIQVVSTSIYHAPGGENTQVFGEFKNKEACGVDDVRFNITYLYHGNEIETREITYFYYLSENNNYGLLHIEPSCVTPFTAPLPYSFGPIDSVRIEFTLAVVASVDPFSGFLLEGVAGQFNTTIQEYRVNGTIRNHNATKDLYINAIVTFYRADGTVVGVASDTPLFLRQGEWRSFHIAISSDECDVTEIAQYRVQVAGYGH